MIEKSKNTRTDEEEQKQDFYGIDEGTNFYNISIV